MSSELSPGSAGKEYAESTDDRELGKKLDQYKVGEEVNCFVKMVSFMKPCKNVIANDTSNGTVDNGGTTVINHLFARNSSSNVFVHSLCIR